MAGVVPGGSACAIMLAMEAGRHPGGRQSRMRPGLELLVRELANLPADERREVVIAAEEEAATRKPTLPWESWEAAGAAVTFGGDAVEDCDRLYDGT